MLIHCCTCGHKGKDWKTRGNFKKDQQNKLSKRLMKRYDAKERDELEK